jgi:hypothetical protein
MTDETRRYLAKRKLSGIAINTVVNEKGLLCLDSIYIQDASIKLYIDVKDIENGNVVISKNFMKTLSRYSDRYHASQKYDKKVVIIDNINFEIQDLNFLLDCLDPIAWYMKLGDKGLLSDFTLNKNSYNNFCKAVYKIGIQKWIGTAKKVEYNEALYMVKKLFSFHEYYAGLRVQEKVKEIYNVDSDKTLYFVISTEEYNDLMSLVNKMQEGIHDGRYHFNDSPEAQKDFNEILKDLADLAIKPEIIIDLKKTYNDLPEAVTYATAIDLKNTPKFRTARKKIMSKIRYAINRYKMNIFVSNEEF